MNEILKIKNVNELDKLITKNGRVVLKAGADWCGPCKVLENTLKNLDKNEITDTVIAEFDVDEADDIVQRLGIRNIPVLFFYKDGEENDKVIGNVTANNIYAKIKKL